MQQQRTGVVGCLWSRLPLPTCPPHTRCPQLPPPPCRPAALPQACWMPWVWAVWWQWATPQGRWCAWSWRSGSRTAWQVRLGVRNADAGWRHDCRRHSVAGSTAGQAACCWVHPFKLWLQAVQGNATHGAPAALAAGLGFVAPALPTTPDNSFTRRANLGQQLRFLAVRGLLQDDRLGLRCGQACGWDKRTSLRWLAPVLACLLPQAQCLAGHAGGSRRCTRWSPPAEQALHATESTPPWLPCMLHCAGMCGARSCGGVTRWPPAARGSHLRTTARRMRCAAAGWEGTWALLLAAG